MNLIRFKQSSHIYAIGTIFLWASAYVYTKVALSYFTPYGLSLLRYIAASIAILLIAFIKRIGFPDKKDIPKFFLSGAFGFTLYMLAFNLGSKTLTATTASLVIATVPVFTAFFASFVFKEKLKIWCWLAILIEFVGIMILTLWNGVLSINIGIIWVLCAAFIFSGYNLTQRQYTKKYTALQSTTYSIIAGTILLLVFLPEAVPQILNAPFKQMLVIVYLGAFPSAIGFFWWSKALSIAKRTSDVSNYMFVTPLIAMLLEYVVRQQTPDISTYIGGLVILFGLVLFSKANNR